MPLNALFGLAFATATPHGLTSRHATNSQAHSSKGTQSRPPTRDDDAPTACRRTVSGTLSLPSRGTFHHSLTVLFTIGHQGVFRLTGWSRRIQAGFHGPRPTWDTSRQRQQFRLQDSHPLRSAFPDCSPTTIFYHCPPSRQTGVQRPTTPHAQPLPGITRTRFSLIRFRSPLLTESRLFSLPEGTEMFHFPSFPAHTLYIQVRLTPHDWGRVPPFGNPRITARSTAPRGLSQSPTSFIGSWCQGIHRAPLSTYSQRCSRPLSRSQTTHAHTTRPRPTDPTPRCDVTHTHHHTHQHPPPHHPHPSTHHPTTPQKDDRTTGRQEHRTTRRRAPADKRVEREPNSTPNVPHQTTPTSQREPSSPQQPEGHHRQAGRAFHP